MTPLKHFSNIIKCQKQTNAPYQTMNYWETLRITIKIIKIPTNIKDLLNAYAT